MSLYFNLPSGYIRRVVYFFCLYRPLQQNKYINKINWLIKIEQINGDSWINQVCNANLFVSTGCSSYLSGYYGSFNSPNYPYNYPDNKNCVWTISVPYGRYVSLEFRSFSLESGSGCRYDFVEIRDGSSAYGRVLGKFCGSARPPRIVSSGNSMRVHFRSDGSKSYQGFSARFYAVGFGK